MRSLETIRLNTIIDIVEDIPSHRMYKVRINYGEVTYMSYETIKFFKGVSK